MVLDGFAKLAVSATRNVAHPLRRSALIFCAASIGTRVFLGAGPDSFAPSLPPTTRVGPPHGSLLVVGGGTLGPEIYRRFIDLAGGPDALIIDVPTAGGDSAYSSDWSGARVLRAAGARNVKVLHTISRKIADSDSFAAPLRRAGGVWFDGGRHWRLVDSYLGTKTENEFHQVLARGGVVGGTSAGASIQASFLVRGAREGNAIIIAPHYQRGFGFLRDVAIDQHVVARERLPDIADSLMPRHPELLGLSEDEGTAWYIRGDTAEIIGRSKAFVYGGSDPTDAGKPFLTLYPGDRYDLAGRHVVSRAIEGSRLTAAFVDSLFADFNQSGATVLVAQDGHILVDKAYGIPRPPKYMPATTIPNFPLLGVSQTFNTVATLLAESENNRNLDDLLNKSGHVTLRQFLSRQRDDTGSARRLAALIKRADHRTYRQFMMTRLFTPIGMPKTTASDDGQVSSNVDELYRWDQTLYSGSILRRDSLTRGSVAEGDTLPGFGLGWQVDAYRGLERQSAYGARDGTRHAFVRFPSRHVAIIVLTNRADADARGIAGRLADRLLF
jgi:cyanophycinase